MPAASTSGPRQSKIWPGTLPRGEENALLSPHANPSHIRRSQASEGRAPRVGGEQLIPSPRGGGPRKNYRELRESITRGVRTIGHRPEPEGSFLSRHQPHKSRRPPRDPHRGAAGILMRCQSAPDGTTFALLT